MNTITPTLANLPANRQDRLASWLQANGADEAIAVLKTELALGLIEVGEGALLSDAGRLPDGTLSMLPRLRDIDATVRVLTQLREKATSGQPFQVAASLSVRER
jgi:hypothetical protein